MALVPSTSVGGGAAVLGSTTKTSAFSTASASAVQVTGLTVTVTCAGTPIVILVSVDQFANNTLGAYAIISLWDGVVGAGTQLAACSMQAYTANAIVPGNIAVTVTPTAGSKTYNVGLSTAGAGTAAITAAATSPASLVVVGA